ncbi:MAG: ATP-dependent helicase [Desulfosporosinus sp.]|nr:ATP-dependent helicase [Desulfosporosinus sp.]
MDYSKMKNTLKKATPTSTQQTIIASGLYPGYLKAGAGTGKTKVLIDKILRILEDDPDAGLDNFAIITFTNKATEEMKERLMHRIYFEWLKHHKDTIATKTKTPPFMRKQVEISNMLDISTIHSFCEKLLRQYGLQMGLPLNFKIKSVRKETNDIINRVIDRHHNNSVFARIPQHKLAKLIDMLLKNNKSIGIDIDEDFLRQTHFNTPDNEYWNQFKQLFLQIYLEVDREIEDYKISENILTINDLIKKAARLLEIGYVQDKVAQKYKYVFIDEFQDTNQDQFKLVRHLLTKGVKIFLVGDDKQSIYAFRGSDVQNSLEMAKIIDEIMAQAGEEHISDQSVMNENFRTDYQLLEIINEIFQQKFTHNNHELRFPQMRLEKIEEHKNRKQLIAKPLRIVFETPLETIIHSIIQDPTVQIPSDSGSGSRPANYGDICVLFRSNFDLDSAASALRASNIPIEVVGGKSFYKAQEIIDTFKLFNSMIHSSPVYQTELKFTDYYKALLTNEGGIGIDKFLSDLKVVFKRESIEGILNYIYDTTMIQEYYRHNQEYQKIANLNKLKDKARNLMTDDAMQPLQFLEYLQVMISSNQEEDDASIPEHDRSHGLVSLYSIHKAKGLDFPIVIIPHLDKRLNRKTIEPNIIFLVNERELAINHSFIGDSELKPDLDFARLHEHEELELLEEEIRVLYVALTRAKHLIVLSCEKSQGLLVGMKNRAEYASWAKWINGINRGNFLRQYIHIINL